MKFLNTILLYLNKRSEKGEKLELSMKHLIDLRVKMIYNVRYVLKITHTFTLIKRNFTIGMDVALISF